MPIDSSIANLQSPHAVREAVAAHFPKTRYHWLVFDHSHHYETTDGIHLTQVEADRITETMIHHVNQIHHSP